MDRQTDRQTLQLIHQHHKCAQYRQRKFNYTGENKNSEQTYLKEMS